MQITAIVKWLRYHSLETPTYCLLCETWILDHRKGSVLSTLWLYSFRFSNSKWLLSVWLRQISNGDMRLENKDIRLASAVLEVELHQTSALSVPTCPDPGRLLTVKPATSNYKLGQADPCIPYAGEAAGKSVCVPEHTEFGSFLVKGRWVWNSPCNRYVIGMELVNITFLQTHFPSILWEKISEKFQTF